MDGPHPFADAASGDSERPPPELTPPAGLCPTLGPEVQADDIAGTAATPEFAVPTPAPASEFRHRAAILLHPASANGSPTELEQRVRRLEDALAHLQDGRAEPATAVASVVRAVPVTPGEATAQVLLDVGRRWLGGTDSATPVTALPRRPAWLIVETWAEARAIVRMFLDPRYRLSWTGRIVPAVLLAPDRLLLLVVAGDEHPGRRQLAEQGGGSAPRLRAVQGARPRGPALPPVLARPAALLAAVTEGRVMIRLGVNIDHVATVRQARRGDEPDPVAAAVLALLGGADGITIHLREDRRHIQDRDVRLLRPVVTHRLNLEMAAVDAIVDIACEVKPDEATLVPEKRAGTDHRGRPGRGGPRGGRGARRRNGCARPASRCRCSSTRTRGRSTRRSGLGAVSRRDPDGPLLRGAHAGRLAPRAGRPAQRDGPRPRPAGCTSTWATG